MYIHQRLSRWNFMPGALVSTTLDGPDFQRCLLDFFLSLFIVGWTPLSRYFLRPLAPSFTPNHAIPRHLCFALFSGLCYSLVSVCMLSISIVCSPSTSAGSRCNQTLGMVLALFFLWQFYRFSLSFGAFFTIVLGALAARLSMMA